MEDIAFSKLDNPVWFSLSENHAPFAVDYGHLKCYHPDYCPFGGFDSETDISASLENYSALVDHFYIVGERPELPDSLRIKNELICCQMTIHQKLDIEGKDEIIKLGEEHHDAVYQLVNLVQPGYFKKKTFLLGQYFGIFQDSKLVAVTGERMKMDGFIEVSAVVTHPDHLGKGYAKQLVAHGVNNILQQGKTPFLHVVETNNKAIRLYEKLGFRLRRKIIFWEIVK
jgi:ribosomal protein S18 acetylase RimI-like enzyme